MRTLYIECNMGIAGDMLVGALLDMLSDDERQEAVRTIQSFAVEDVSISVAKGQKMSITGTKFDVHINKEHGAHHHRHMSDIYDMIDSFPIGDDVRADAKAVYSLIADAESDVHGAPVTEIHLHEVGMKDAIIDIVSACYLINRLGVRVVSSPITTGYGSVMTAHGMMNVPAPATAILLRGIPIKGGDIAGELCTPTGAALIKHYAREFTPSNDMTIAAIGVGLGTKDFDRPNCVRAFLSIDDDAHTIAELRCEVDDMTGEEMGYALQKLMSSGAKDAYVKPIVMKKSRPAMELTVLAAPEDCDDMARLIFRHTTTIGIRRIMCTRYEMERRIEEVGAVHIKRSSYGSISKEKPEFDDLAKIADERNISVFEAKKLI